MRRRDNPFDRLFDVHVPLDQLHPKACFRLAGVRCTCIFQITGIRQTGIDGEIKQYIAKTITECPIHNSWVTTVSASQRVYEVKDPRTLKKPRPARAKRAG